MSYTNELLADAEKIRIVPTSFYTGPSAAKYIYMRPNIDNGGNVPAAGPYCTSPDIWANGTSNYPNYVTALATSASYNTNPPSDITLKMDNYIYIRGYNGSSAAATTTVTLYYAPSGIIQYPSMWQNNVIGTDTGKTSSAITNLAPATVGVASDTFLWKNVQPTSDHYCLITQFNDAQNSNPFPSTVSVIDLSAMITKNLKWGWHNMNLMNPTNNLTFSYETGLNIPANAQSGYYTIATTPVGFVGWQVSFQCSQSDSKGNPITFPITDVKQDNLSLGIQNVYLAAGYNGVVTVYLYNPNNQTPITGATAPIAASYLTNGAREYWEAVERGVVDWNLTALLAEEENNLSAEIESSMPVQAYIAVGTVSGKIK